MAWTWDQSAGALSRNGVPQTTGYSGKGRGKNNPALQGVVGVGPLPRGRWRMVNVYNSSRVGPYAITLYAEDGKDNDTHEPTGRGAFRIHGDSVRSPGDASNGCIILPRVWRERMWKSGDHTLIVVE